MFRGIKIIYGAGTAGSWSSEVDGPKVLDVIEKFGISQIDTARKYKGSEELLGKRGAAARFSIDTKHPGGHASHIPATKENILAVAKTSLDLLRTDKVHTYYIHAPDRNTPLEDTLDGINELFREGRFKHFGLSNFLPSEVEEVVRVAKERGFVPPTVYQGNYSAIARKQETELFPILRKHGIVFNAYSPSAGGFLTKSAKDLQVPIGRFDPKHPLGSLYMKLYKKPAFLAALDDWEAISAESEIPKFELAYRWVAYHSALRGDLGDGMVVGAGTLDQLRQTLTALEKGPLPDKVVKQIEDIWPKVKDEPGLDNFNKSDP